MNDFTVYLRQDGRERLKSLFGVSDSYLSQCFHFKINGMRARKLRQYAVNMEGAIVV